MEAKNKINLLEYVKGNTAGQVVKVGKDTYRVDPCPVCGHKEHFTINAAGNYYKSFSECCRGGSIIDYLMEVEKMEKPQAMEKVERIAGVGIEEARSVIEQTSSNTTQYYYSRGLTDKTINKYKLGYLPDGHKIGKSFKYVLPVTEDFCILRSENESDRYRNIGNPKPLNLNYLSDPCINEIFIVEGYFDALSLEEIDKPAIALNSTSGTGAIVGAIEANQEALKGKLLIISLDNDTAGDTSANTIKEKLQELGLQYIDYKPGDHKDINAALVADKEKLKESIAETLDGWQEKTLYRGTVYEYMQEAFEVDQARRLSEPDIKTGIDSLDRALGGGLYPGLYILGAISSLGKTALALQVADTIAAAGHPVFFYSLEMGRYEMLCRSLAREYFKTTGIDTASTAQFIKPAAGNDIYSDPEFKNILKTYQDNAAKNLFLIEGDFKTTIETIENVPAGKRPVIIIDYLQVVQPQEGSRLSEKQHIDQVIVRLKQLSRKLDIPVIAVSSFNRESYKEEKGPSMAAFKESGGIEYSADVLLYMQLRKNEGEEINAIKNMNPRPINLLILKNRRGPAYEPMKLDYYTRQNYFVEPRR